MDPYSLSHQSPVAGKSVRLLRPSIVILCGPAGCGKSTFAKSHFRPTQIISSDWARGLICDDERDQRYNAQAFALVHFLVDQRLKVNRLCVVDSTALTTQSRRDLLTLAAKRQVPATLILFDVPLKACVERDEKRERSVGRSVVERQFQAFQDCIKAVRAEGFDQILELHEDDSENFTIEILFRPVTQSVPLPQSANSSAAPRRFERSAPPAGSRTGNSGDGADADLAASAPLPAPPASAPRPDRKMGSGSTPSSATPAGKVLAPLTDSMPDTDVPASKSLPGANKLSAPSPPAAATEPAPSLAPRAAALEAKEASGR